MQGVLIQHSSVEAAHFWAVFDSAPDAYLVLPADPPTFTMVAAEDLTVQSDPMRVRQILSNLLSNAVKYTREGNVTVTANRKSGDDARRSGEWIAISVSDTGSGIPADKKQTISQEFTRLDPNAPHGAGVGLAISGRIARLLGAEITVESEEGRGSSFTLWLPA